MGRMYIIAGLGNPDAKYKNTRHNIGFDFIDFLADKYNIDVSTAKHKGICGKGIIEGEKVVLLKPLTYMNLSGESIIEAVNFYKIDPETELIVCYDDIALDVGKIRVRKKGTAGGHNGMKNIIAHLHTENFTRIRLGVGDKPKNYDLADYVLGHFSEEERGLMDEGLIDGMNALKVIVTEDVDKAMNIYNKKKEA